MPLNATRNATDRTPRGWYPLILLVYIAFGVIFGLVHAGAEIQRHSYLELGFRRAIVIVLTEETTRYALIGAVFGATCLAARLAGHLMGAIARRLDRTAESEAPSQVSLGPLWPYTACLLIGLTILAIEAQKLGMLSSKRVWAAVIASGLWCAMFALWRLRTRSAERPGLVPRALFFALYSLPAAFVLSALGPRRSELPEVSRGELLLASVPVTIILLVVLIRHPLPSARPSRVSRTLWLIAVVAAVPIAVRLLPPFATLPQTYRAARPLNVVLIGIDTLRLDHTRLIDGPAGRTPGAPATGAPDAPDGMPGAPPGTVRGTPGLAASRRDLTPSLRDLAAGGSVFTSAISQAPWTLPAFASIMTGKYPREHGAISPFGALAKPEVTLAEILREAGYRTAGVVSHVYVDADRGFAQGFDDFNDDNALGHWEITSAHVTDEAIALLERRGDEPFFLFAHYFDPHYEYRDHVDWSYADGYDGWLRDAPLDIQNLRHNRHLMSPDDLGYLTDLYDEEIAFTDREIGRLAARLRETGLMQETVIAVVADHGEEFLERGWLGHTTSLHDEIVRVPMLIRVPGLKTAPIVTETVETRSLFQTLLDCVGVDWDRPKRPPSLLALMGASDRDTNDGGTSAPQASAAAGADAEPELHGMAFSEVWLPDVPLDTGNRTRMSCVRTNHWKLITDHGRQRAHAFNLDVDPGERHVLAAEPSTPAGVLLARLAEWLSGMEGGATTVPHQEPSEELLQQLKSLGYVSGNDATGRSQE